MTVIANSRAALLMLLRAEEQVVEEEARCNSVQLNMQEIKQRHAKEKQDLETECSKRVEEEVKLA